MKKIEIEIPDGKEAKWVDGVLTLVDEKPIEYKFKVGDKVKITIPNNPQYGEITKLGGYAGEPLYTIKSQDAVFNNVYERYLEPFTQGITERIKTFDDACYELGYDHHFVIHYKEYYHYVNNKYIHDAANDDILAYLKLRIITAALNEGWESTIDEGEERWVVSYVIEDKRLEACLYYCLIETSTRLIFKSARLAEYAATQFVDIYADFYGCKKGGEK